MDVVMRFVAARRFIHHPQHLYAAGRDEPPHQKDCEKKKRIPAAWAALFNLFDGRECVLKDVLKVG
jgi:hypothetical protein